MCIQGCGTLHTFLPLLTDSRLDMIFNLTSGHCIKCTSFNIKDQNSSCIKSSPSSTFTIHSDTGHTDWSSTTCTISDPILTLTIHPQKESANQSPHIRLGRQTNIIIGDHSTIINTLDNCDCMYYANNL